MRKIQSVIGIGLLLAFVSFNAGCLAVAAAAGAGAGVAYVRGDTVGNIESAPQQVIDAARQTFASQNIHVSSEQADDDKIVLKGVTRDDRNITVTARQRAEGLTRLSVRVGVFGDREVSGRLFHE